MWSFHLHSHRAALSRYALSLHCLPTQCCRAPCVYQRTHPEGHWLVHGETEPSPVQLYPERVQPDLLCRTYRLSDCCFCQCRRRWARHLTTRRLWGHTHSEVNFFDRDIETVMYIHIHPCLFLKSIFPFSRYGNLHTEVHGYTRWVCHTVPFPPQSQFNKSSCIKSGSRTECWLHAKKWSTHKERVRHDFCPSWCAHKLCFFQIQGGLAHGRKSLHILPLPSRKRYV